MATMMQWLMGFTFLSWLLLIITMGVDIWAVVTAQLQPEQSSTQYFGLFQARGNTGKNFGYTDDDVPLAPLDTLHKAGSGAFVMIFIALLLVTAAFALMGMIMQRKLEMDSQVLTYMYMFAGVLCFGSAACWFGAGYFHCADLYNNIGVSAETYIGGSLVMAVVDGAFICFANAWVSQIWKSKLNTSTTI